MAIRKDLFCQYFLGMFLKKRGQEKYFFISSENGVALVFCLDDVALIFGFNLIEINFVILRPLNFEFRYWSVGF